MHYFIIIFLRLHNQSRYEGGPQARCIVFVRLLACAALSYEYDDTLLLPGVCSR